MLHLVTAVALASVAQASQVSIQLVSDAPVSTMNQAYASWNIDSSCNRGFHHTNFSNPNLAAAAVGLQPSRLRFGGSGNDNLVYGLSPGSPECANVKPTDCGFGTVGCLNATHWGDLYAFSRAAGADFIFGLAFGDTAACAQGPKYVWNSTNAQQLLSYLIANNQSVWGFELGNEINLGGPGTGCNLRATQQADALVALSGMLSGGSLSDAKLIGPDGAGNTWLPWLEEYLAVLPHGGLLHAITNHVYNGMTTLDFNSPAQLDNSLPEIANYTNASRALYPTAEIWGGELGPHGGGNDGSCLANAVCGNYASTMWYADDMAQRAKHGFTQYQRQDLFGGAYGLTNTVTGISALGPTEPIVIRPDYWINFLWKRTLGVSVYNASSGSVSVRAYAFAGTPPSPFAAAECASSPLQLVLINLDNTTSATVTLPPAPLGATASQYAAWTLTALPDQPEGPFTRLTAINGEATPVTIDTSVEDPSKYLSHITQPAVSGAVSDGASLPPISTTFVCYHE